LNKVSWGQTDRSGHTDEKGYWETAFKTDGDFGIMIAPGIVPTKYGIVIWVGKEIVLQYASSFREYNESDRSPGFFKMYRIYIIITAIIFVALFLLLKVKNRKKMKNAIISLVLLAPIMLEAQWRNPPGESKETWKQVQKAQESITKLFETTNNLLDATEKLKQGYEALKTLDKKEVIPDVSSTGPMMPSSCAGYSNKTHVPGGSCDCFAKALDRLNRNRTMLEKLRIKSTNIINFADTWVDFGDAMAGLHPMLEYGWVIQKIGITKEKNLTRSIAIEKHKEIMRAIHESLIALGDCEAKFGERDWYQKFGFMYYEFLEDKYRPAF
jgi:hypothetical protein